MYHMVVATPFACNKANENEALKTLQSLHVFGFDSDKSESLSSGPVQEIEVTPS